MMYLRKNTNLMSVLELEELGLVLINQAQQELKVPKSSNQALFTDLSYGETSEKHYKISAIKILQTIQVLGQKVRSYQMILK
jgi:hypothetical protein